MAAHRYWLIIIRAQGTYSTGLSEVELHTSVGGADVTGSGTATASSAYSGTYAASKAFDDNNNSDWAASTANPASEWIAYDFGEGNDVDIVEVILRSRHTADPAPIQNFDICYSDDGATWIVAAPFMGQTAFNARDQSKTYALANKSSPYASSPVLYDSNTFLIYTVSASSFYSAGYEAFRAFMLSTTQLWASATGTTGWLKVDHGSGNTPYVTSYTIRARSSFPNQSPKTFTLEGSNNDTDWTTVDTVASSSGWAANEERTFTVDTPGQYRYYRLNITDTDGGSNIAIGKLWLYAEEAPPGGYSLSAGSGSFSETGTAAALKATRKLTVGSGSFAEAGTAAALELGRKLAALGGSFVLSGTAAGLRTTRLLSAASGVFEETGSAATLTYLQGRILAAGAGAFALSGASAGLLATRILVPGSGAFLESGTAAGLLRGYKVAALSGAFALTGTEIDFLYNRLLSAGPGAFTLTMTPAGLVYVTPTDYVLDAGSGTFLISGGVVYFPRPGASRTCFIFQKRRDHFRT